MSDKAEKVNLFAHPITFVLTHVVFPLFAVGALGYVYWLTVEALAKAEGALGTKMLVALGAAAAIPLRRRCGLRSVRSGLASGRRSALRS